jgi:hypothetical protein
MLFRVGVRAKGYIRCPGKLDPATAKSQAIAAIRTGPDCGVERKMTDGKIEWKLGSILFKGNSRPISSL